MKVVLATGGFDPLHSGHIRFLQAAKALGDFLVVGINSDDWLKRKKGQAFMNFEERMSIIQALSCVDKAVGFDDSDDTACGAIKNILSAHDGPIIFANGGDRTDANIPEMKFDASNLYFEFGVGGTNKANSSSWILDEWKTQKTDRPWGYWRVLDHKPDKGYKVKELVIHPGESLSDQRHFKRSEHWHMLEGRVEMQTEYLGKKETAILQPQSAHGYKIGQGVWHKATNSGKVPAHVLEVQWGQECTEQDIERRD